MNKGDVAVDEGTAFGIVEHVVSADFDVVLQRVTKAISAAGMTVFASIDHAAGAREAGMSMPPSTVLIYGHARGGTPIMLAAPQAALDLPLRVLVRRGDNDTHTVIAFHPIVSLLQAAGVPNELAAKLEPAQRLLLAAVAEPRGAG